MRRKADVQRLRREKEELKGKIELEAEEELNRKAEERQKRNFAKQNRLNLS